MVGRTVSEERLRLTRLLDRALTPELEGQLQALLEADEGMYKISLLKHEPKDTSYGELRQERERGTFFSPSLSLAAPSWRRRACPTRA